MATTLSVQEACLNGIVGDIIALNLPGLPQGRVYGQLVANPEDLTYPCVLVSFGGEVEEQGDGDFENLEIVYPFRVNIEDREPARYLKAFPRYCQWRQMIAHHFQVGTNFTIPVPEVFDTEVRPLVIIDPQTGSYLHVVSGMIVRVSTCQAK